LTIDTALCNTYRMIKLLNGKRYGLAVGGSSVSRLVGWGRAYQQVSPGTAFVAFWTPATGFVVVTWRGVTVVKSGRFFSRIWRPWRPLGGLR
jgi:hypothetical protein